jgi:hypothetical protein
MKLIIIIKVKERVVSGISSFKRISNHKVTQIFNLCIHTITTVQLIIITMEHTITTIITITIITSHILTTVKR